MLFRSRRNRQAAPQTFPTRGSPLIEGPQCVYDRNGRELVLDGPELISFIESNSPRILLSPPPVQTPPFIRDLQTLDRPELTSLIGSDLNRPRQSSRTPPIGTDRRAVPTDSVTPSLFTSILIVATYCFACLYFSKD